MGRDARRLVVELHGDDVLTSLLVESGIGALDLLTADDRLVQQIDLFVVLRAGHQRKVRVIVACQYVIVVAAGGLELQRQDLDLLIAALPQLLLVGDARRQILLVLWHRFARRRCSWRGRSSGRGRRRCRGWRWFLRVRPWLRRRGLRRRSRLCRGDGPAAPPGRP